MKIILLSPIDHDGKQLKEGATVDLPDDIAEALVKSGAAEKPGRAKPADDASNDGKQG